ncbi:hypothetical protein [Pseudoalteromonas phage PH357]|nr:hypothetical protein [Pseudoalteromonas phage PH357]
MIKNVYNALRKVLPYQEGDCISNTSLSSENASEELESDSKEVIIPEGVSEPVISFVKCFQENPKRFKVGKAIVEDVFPHLKRDIFIIVDRFTDIKYAYADREDNVMVVIEGTEPTFLPLTLKEISLCKEVLTRYNEDRSKRVGERISRMETSKEDRRQKELESNQKRLREKLTNIYKEDNNASNK